MKVEDTRKASRNANLKKPYQKLELAPPGQDFVVTMVIPNAGTFSVSTVEDDMFIEIWDTTSETRSIVLTHGSAPIHI